MASSGLKCLFLAALLVSAFAMALSKDRVARKDLGVDLGGVGVGMAWVPV